MIEDKAIPGYERVIIARRPEIGLTAIIAVHSTLLGPAAGGLRMYPYASEEAALTDALRLSRGMTYKNAAADLPLGGGKAVVIANPARDKTDAMLRGFAEAVEALKGTYWTAEDMGMNAADMGVIAERTRFVAGLATGDHASGDPSPITARGVFNAMRIAARRRLGADTLSGLTIAVQGLGHVGGVLCELAAADGARLIVTDTDEARLVWAAEALKAEVTSLDNIYDAPADIFAPCAIGAILNDQTIPRLRARVIAGAANNQLAEPRHGAALAARGILYAPDYIANGGGIINVAAEIARIDNRPQWVETKLSALCKTLEGVFDLAETRAIPPSNAADAFVEDRLAAYAR